ncbi:DoxX family protein [Membranihabitans maritimus]|uniref:DoxX family protein n=1 Tax=Membranihabitans maritimus TaxID=2904244 RepID=UPI001F2B3A78|nr:DoxX family protein [Membranihabitans maritimus]
MKDIIDLLGRIFLSAMFLYEAYDSIYYFERTKETMTDYGINWNQDMLLICAIILLLVGGIMLLIGYRVTIAAIFLLIYYLPLTFIIHSWWNEPIEMQRKDAIDFMQNMAIIGGLMLLMGRGSGRYSIKRLFATTRVPRKYR